MGLVYVSGYVATGPGAPSIETHFLIDSGATYSLLTRDLCERLAIEPVRDMSFVLADGTQISRGIGECYVELPIDGARGHCPVIIGEAGDDENLLGAVTLEIFGLMLDPLRREIRPARMLLK